jgi:hypothetical protein
MSSIIRETTYVVLTAGDAVAEHTRSLPLAVL